jgi:hypothetical protein
VSLATAGRDQLEAGDGTMATFTEWMRLGEARMTPLATLALGAAMAWIAPESADAAPAATGERSVSGVRILLGEESRRWTLVPTMLDGKVESFVALREDLAYGENLTAVWYRKVAAADGTESWETKAFEDQDQSKAIRAVKDALALADATDGSWPAPVAPVAAAAPETLVKGVLETDALAPLVADLDDPQPLVEMLEGAGWKAAWIGPLEGVAVATAEPDVIACPKTAVLAALATTVEQSWPASPAAADALACAQAICTRYGPETAWSPWTCGPWTLATKSPLTGCFTTCRYTREVSSVKFRQVVEFDCGSGAQLGTYFQTKRRVGNQSVDMDPISGAATPVQVTQSCQPAQCPSAPVLAPDNNPSCGDPGTSTEKDWTP